MPEEEELPGLTFYGLAPLGGPAALSFPDDVWLYALDARPLRLHGEGWQVRGWDLPLLVWPVGDAFRDAVRATLAALIAGGARVAWVGASGVPFCDPPGLLDPGSMSESVLAWLTEDGWFGCPLDPTSRGRLPRTRRCSSFGGARATSPRSAVRFSATPEEHLPRPEPRDRCGT